MFILRKGFIYVITNKTNNKKYVGQTSRDIFIRFHEHLYETKGNSHLHNAIQKEGRANFKIEQLEEVPIDELDARERFWIKELNTLNPEIGYNITVGGQGCPLPYNRILVLENNLVFDSLEEMGRMIRQLTSWSLTFIKNRLSRAIDSDQDFLTYHLKSIPYLERKPSDVDVLEDWIKTLNIRFQGKHIYCIELDKDFDTTGQAAKYLLDNNLYCSRSKTPIQSLITSINTHLKGKTSYIEDTEKRKYHFEQIPGSGTKNNGAESPFQKKKIYCPELNKEFDNGTEAAHYFIDNQIWKGIVFKTAKLRISDVMRGVFPDYKGYTFKEV